jgi:hypothetical protein
MVSKWKGARRPAALVLALLGWGALALQFSLTVGTVTAQGRSGWAAVIVLAGYFTILTNLLCAVCMTAVCFSRFVDRPSPNLLSATTLYIATVGMTYALLLSHLFSFEGSPWLADRLLHYVIPVAFVVYWLIFVPKGTLRWTAPIVWLIYPLAYLAFSLVRGALSGWYPYPFINVATLGYRAALLNALGLTVTFFVSGLGLVAWDKQMGRRGKDLEPR